tara:strand:- start:42 stop:971 length:930 start_codon:yes stop_codon:yes gene_type:complete
MKKIHSIVTYLDISDGNMQEGSFRCDANVSVRKTGDNKLGTRTELKNINSFKFVEKAINYEIKRQIDLLEDGKTIVQETRLYDENKDVTRSMRSKEEANDYRYFPDPDLLPIEIDKKFIGEVKESLPVLPDIKNEFYKSNYNFSDDQISIILGDSYTTNFIDQVLSYSKIEPQKVVNYFISSIYAKLNKEKLKLSEGKIDAKEFCEILDLIENKNITRKDLKNIIDDIWSGNYDMQNIVEKYSSENSSSETNVDDLIKNIILNNEKQVQQYKSGKTKIIGFFVGQVLKEAKGSDPSIIKDKIIKFLDAI